MKRRSGFERLSATADQHNGRVFIAWAAGPVSGTLSLTADEAIAVGDVGAALKATQQFDAQAAAAALARVRDVVKELRKHAEEAQLNSEICAYTDAADWLDNALGGERP